MLLDSPSGPAGPVPTRALIRGARGPALRPALRPALGPALRSGLPARHHSTGVADRLIVTAREAALATATMLPALGRSLAVAAMAFAAERALSASIGGALGRVLRPIERAAPAFSRTEITEWIVVERIRRR